MANPFVHVELQSQNTTQATEFYGALFDWKFEDTPMQDSDQHYTMIQTGEDVGGGMMQHPVPQAPSTWIPYVNVTDVQQSTDKALSLGATILREKTAVPEHGWFSIIQDPTGAVIGLWQNKN